MSGQFVGPLVDPHRTVCLCDVGNRDYILTISVDADGNDKFWLCRKDLLGDQDADIGDPDPRHEQLGRLPQHVRDRIWGDRLKCGRPRGDGLPCRQRVTVPGRSCWVHRSDP
jgi:hypothetical protein